MVHCYAGAGGWKGRFGAAIPPYEGVRLLLRLSECGMCPPFRSGAAHGVPATRLPPHPVVDSLPLRRKPRRLKQPTGLFPRAGFRIHFT